MDIKTAGVIGAGVMGSGVAQVLAQTGYRVLLIDIDEGRLNQVKREIQNNLRFQGLFKKSENKEPPAAVIERISFTTDYDALIEANFIIENVTEKWDVKKDVYSRIDRIAPANAVFACNTSAIPITKIASATNRPDRVIGMHFMNPVPMISMVEVIRGYHTSEETIGRARQLLAEMGKECVIVNDSPGFVTNRVLMLTINEAIWLVFDQVAPAGDVDKIFKTCFGHKMGPLETADLIGLDTILNSIEVLYECFNDSKYRPCPLLKKMVDAGLYGRKSGQGFYAYFND